MSVDFEKRRTFTSFYELCGPIVEVLADDTISVVQSNSKTVSITMSIIGETAVAKMG